MLTGKEGASALVLEAVADHNGRIWHLFFGCPGSLNDLSFLPSRQTMDQAELNHVLFQKSIAKKIEIGQDKDGRGRSAGRSEK